MTSSCPQALDNNIFVIDTGYQRKNLAASHLLIEQGKAAFIDVGTSYSADRLLVALTGLGLSPSDVRYLILTHIHLDHAGGAGELARRCPNAQILVHHRGAPHIINPEKLIAGSIAVYGEQQFQRLYGQIHAIDSQRVTAVDDQYQLDFLGRKLLFIDTPGHARHHLCIWDEKSHGIFTGDALGIAYPEMQQHTDRPFLFCTTTPSAFEPEAMIASIKRLLHLQPQVFYLTHFGQVNCHPGAVAALIEQIRTHATLALSLANDLPRLKEAISQLFVRCYRDYCGEKESQLDLPAFLAGDIELNARGAALWALRQRNR